MGKSSIYSPRIFFLPPCYRIGKSFKSFFLDMFHHCEPNIYLVSHIPGIPILSHRTRSMTTPWDPWVVSGRRLTACGDWVVGPRRFCPTATWHRNHRSRRWKLKWLWVKTLHPKWYTFCHSWYCWMVIPPVHSQVLTHPQMFFLVWLSMEKVETWLRPTVETYLNKSLLLAAFFQNLRTKFLRGLYWTISALWLKGSNIVSHVGRLKHHLK